MNGQTEIQSALERLILGELAAAEASRMATEAGYRTFADLCEAELPERLPRLRIDRSVVRRRVVQAVQGRLPMEELRGWAEELAAVLDRHELGVTLIERRRLGGVDQGAGAGRAVEAGEGAGHEAAARHVAHQHGVGPPQRLHRPIAPAGRREQRRAGHGHEQRRRQALPPPRHSRS